MSSEEVRRNSGAVSPDVSPADIGDRQDALVPQKEPNGSVPTFHWENAMREAIVEDDRNAIDRLVAVDTLLSYRTDDGTCVIASFEREFSQLLFSVLRRTKLEDHPTTRMGFSYALSQMLGSEYMLDAPLHAALEQGEEDLAQRMIAIDPQAGQRDGFPLYAAAQRACEPSVRFLLSNGAERWAEQASARLERDDSPAQSRIFLDMVESWRRDCLARAAVDASAVAGGSNPGDESIGL